MCDWRSYLLQGLGFGALTFDYGFEGSGFKVWAHRGLSVKETHLITRIWKPNYLPYTHIMVT